MGLLSMLRVGDRGPVARRHRRTFAPGLGLGVENLESRVVLSHTAPAPVVEAPALVGDVLKAVASDNFIINDLDLEGVVYDAATGLLTSTGGTVSGFVGGLPFTTEITNFALQLLPDGDSEEGCSVLDLELGPINLSLLGLHVDTSPICLSITAFEGEGLLGDLLCGLAGGDLGLLDSPILTGGLTEILTSALTQAGPGQGGGGDVESVCTGECEVLELVVGPLDLNLLGVNVHLDDCDDGPVQVCVSATADEGLLGSLLCGLTGPDLLDLQDISKLVRKATSLLQNDGELSLKDIGKLTKDLTKALS
jgi:hypothetical protein